MRYLIDILYLLRISTDRNQFKCIDILLVFYVAYGIFIAFMAYKMLSEDYNFFIFVLTTALISFMFIFDDIIAEVYGIKISAEFYFSMVLFRIATGMFLYTLTDNNDIAKYLLFAALFHPLIYTLAWYINVFLLRKWKILMQGKYFWLRSIGSSAIVISIFCLFLIIEDIKFSHWSIHQIIFGDFIISYILRIIFVVIFAFPANVIVNILKVIEYQGVYTHNNDFNPFKHKLRNTRENLY